MFQDASLIVPAAEEVSAGLGVPVQAVANRARAAKRSEGFMGRVEHEGGSGAYPPDAARSGGNQLEFWCYFWKPRSTMRQRSRMLGP